MDWDGYRGEKRERKVRNGRTVRRRRVYAGILGSMLLLQAIAWNSRDFCDWYVSRVFRIWVGTYGRITGMLPFSVGELLIGLGLVFAAVGILSGLAWGLAGLTGRAAGRQLKRIFKVYYRTAAWILLGVFVLMTLNCYILYHGSGFAGEYLGSGREEFTLEELETLRNFVVEQCNALCCQIPRNEDSSLSYEGNMMEAAISAMGQLGESYEGLSGFYPVAKPLRSSDFMSQQYMAGCFFPFSMEANYNDVMYVMNKPATICHELGHLKGYIREDEANLIGYLACVRSEDIYFRYSGYLSVLYYIDNDFQEAAGHDEYLRQTAILPQVHRDNIFLTSETRDRIEKTALWDTQVVDAISDSIADTSLRLNGVADGMISYSRVVGLLLRYYDMCGYP